MPLNCHASSVSRAFSHSPSHTHSHSPFTLLLECGLNDFLSSFTRFNIENMILQENTSYRPSAYFTNIVYIRFCMSEMKISILFLANMIVPSDYAM